MLLYSTLERSTRSAHTCIWYCYIHMLSRYYYAKRKFLSVEIMIFINLEFSDSRSHDLTSNHDSLTQNFTSCLKIMTL